MATHPSTLAWRIPQTEEPGGLQSTGLQRVGRDWALVSSGSLCWAWRACLRLPPTCIKTGAASGPVLLSWGSLLSGLLPAHCSSWTKGQLPRSWPAHTPYVVLLADLRLFSLCPSHPQLSPGLAAPRTRHVLREDQPLLASLGAKQNSSRRVTAHEDNAQHSASCTLVCFGRVWGSCWTAQPDPGDMDAESLHFQQAPEWHQCPVDRTLSGKDLVHSKAKVNYLGSHSL